MVPVLHYEMCIRDSRALLGGIMGFSTDDMRIRNSFDIAHEKGLKFSFTPNELETDIHPNTVDICMENEKGQKKMCIRDRSSSLSL